MASKSTAAAAEVMISQFKLDQLLTQGSSSKSYISTNALSPFFNYEQIKLDAMSSSSGQSPLNLLFCAWNVLHLPIASITSQYWRNLSKILRI